MSRRITYVKIACVIMGVATIVLIGQHAIDSTSSNNMSASRTRSPTKTSQQKQTPPQPIDHIDNGLQQIVDNWSSKQSFNATIAIHELTGQRRSATHQASSIMTTASTYKLYVAYATLHELEQGSYTMQSTTRTGQTVSAALSKMILDSDNASAEALGFLVGWDHINSLAASIGANNTDINNYDRAGNPVNGNKQSTASDLTTLITKLQQGSLLSKTNTDLLLGLMKIQHWRERIPSGVPSGVAVADKPGWLSNVQNDAAIVYGPRSTYTIVIMTSGSSTRPLADLSKLVYDYLQQ
jgi:beta-lactamase class A